MGTLYLVATPIGNMDDVTIRAIKTLFSVDYIACEDTRRTGQLLHHLESKMKNQQFSIKDLDISQKPKFISYYDEVEFKKIPEIIEILSQDKTVALVSDAGTPLISDPGYKLVVACVRGGIQIVSIPGPTSFVSALVSSGLPTNQFMFLGYVPKTPTQRKKLFTELYRYFDTSIQIKPTIICFDTAIRLQESLSDMQEIFGDIKVVISKELTKLYEETIHGKISECMLKTDMIKGEIVLLFNIPQE